MSARLHAAGRDGIDVDLKRCLECAHHEATAVFDLCKHISSQYSIAGKAGFHTISHMRTVGVCRADASLFSPLTLRRMKL